MAQKKTSDRGFEFACALIDEFRIRRPTDDAERAIWWQLLDSGPSIGANASESGGSESGRDFTHKFHISLKEGKETLYWLRLLRHASPDRSKRINVLYKECDEIVSILVASIKTSKKNEEQRRKQKVERKTSDRERKSKSKAREFWFNAPD